jgi:hypothetical protein
MGCCSGQLRGLGRLDYRSHIQDGWLREDLGGLLVLEKE